MVISQTLKTSLHRVCSAFNSKRPSNHYKKQVAELFHAHPDSFLFSGFTWPLALIGGLEAAPGLGRFYRKDCLCDRCDLVCK
jgi:hypothetical protein